MVLAAVVRQDVQMATTVTEGEPRELRTSSATSMRWQGKLATAFKEAARRSIISSSSAAHLALAFASAMPFAGLREPAGLAFSASRYHLPSPRELTHQRSFLSH